MALDYKVTTLPPTWPGKRTAFPQRSKFKTKWTETLRILEREVDHLGGRKVEIAVDVQPRHLRQDGQLRADARPGNAVVFSFLNGKGERLAFPCDTFAWWQDNLYAIARALEALRMVERYGVSASSQYAGFKALPAQTAPTMTASAAALLIASITDVHPLNVEQDAELAKTAVRSAIFRTHPDRNGGDGSQFERVDAARKVLSSHHGVSL
jgi:hypothetical protein